MYNTEHFHPETWCASIFFRLSLIKFYRFHTGFAHFEGDGFIPDYFIVIITIMNGILSSITLCN